jgi:hypothetical protein
VGGAVEAKDLPVLEQIVSAKGQKTSKTSRKKKK